MRDFLLTVAAMSESLAGPITYHNLREQLAELGLRDFLVNDANEWIALPQNVYAAWVKGRDSDSILAEWHEKLSGHFGSGKSRAAFFLTVGSDAAWQAQVFE
jgi:hypothetical protein